MKTSKAIPHVLACAALLLWTGDLTAEVPGGLRGVAGPLIPELLKYDLQILELPATELEPFTTQVRLGDQVQTLILEPYSMRADDFRVLIQVEGGELQEVEAPPSRTYRGTIQGEAQSRVAGSLIDGQLWAVVRSESGEIWHIQPMSDLGVAGAPNASHVIFQGEDVAPIEGICGTDLIPQPLADLDGQAPAGDPSAGTGLFTTDIAFDADWFYYLLTGSSVPSTVADIENVMNGVEFVYEDDTDIVYEITTFIVRTSSGADPYTSTDPFGLLVQFRNTWNSFPESFIRRDIAQLYTGKNLNGGIIGIAWVSTICNVSALGYSLVQSKFSINMDLRVSLSAHELGHNWSALHCSGGTCHIMCTFINQCGGTTGENLKFGPISINSIVNFRNSRPCLFEQPETIVLPFFDDFNVSVDTDKWSYNFGGLTTSLGVNEPSEPRSLQLDGGSNIYHKDEIRSSFIAMSGQEGAILSYFTEHIGVELGESLFVEYWSPDSTWKILNEIVSDGVNQTQYVFFMHNLPGDAFHNEFRVRFRSTSNEGNDDWYVDDVFIGMSKEPCPWDADGSGDVGISDLLDLLALWGTDPGGPPDYDGDSNVGVSDLLEMLANWGPCP